MIRRQVQLFGLLACLSGSTLLAGGPCYQFEPLDMSVRDAFRAGRAMAHILAEPGWLVWCNSVIRWTDGKYHAYYARWPVGTQHAGWLTDCEIAHGVADKPEGPFAYQGTVIANANPGDWGVNAHNPYAVIAEGKICLYYIANDLRGKPPGVPRSVIRNSQVTGVAIADNPAGPFRRSEQPVVVPHGRFKNIAVNPAVNYHAGKYVMIIKGDDATKEKTHRIQLVGQSDRPEGPFAFLDRPVYAARQTEDACLWYDQTTQRFNMVCHVMGAPVLAWLVSEDGDNWRAAEQPVFMKKEFVMSDGTVWKPARVERPFVLTDELGRPQMLYVAILDGHQQANIALRITQTMEDKKP